jgi:hypothetical protein
MKSPSTSIMIFGLALGFVTGCSPSNTSDAGSDSSLSEAAADVAESDAQPMDGSAPADAHNHDVSQDGSSLSDVAPSDGALDLCSATLQSRFTSCEPANVMLSEEICRCGSRYYWNGSACVGSAACRCTANCDRLFATESECERAHNTCRDGGARD